MAQTATSQAGGVVNFASGSFTGDGAIETVTTGFTPRYVKIVNVTDVIVWEKLEGFTATQTVKTVTAGTTTIDTTSAITFDEDGFSITAAANVNSSTLVWVAWA